jgi:hypothetical protein
MEKRALYHLYDHLKALPLVLRVALFSYGQPRNTGPAMTSTRTPNKHPIARLLLPVGTVALQY